MKHILILVALICATFTSCEKSNRALEFIEEQEQLNERLKKQDTVFVYDSLTYTIQCSNKPYTARRLYKSTCTVSWYANCKWSRNINVQYNHAEEIIPVSELKRRGYGEPQSVTYKIENRPWQTPDWHEIVPATIFDYTFLRIEYGEYGLSVSVLK